MNSSVESRIQQYVKIAYLIVEFDAHTERVDQYRQQNATREITMIDKTLHILTETLPLDCKTDTQLQQNCTVLHAYKQPRAYQ